MTMRRPLVLVGGLERELPLADQIPVGFALLSSTGDLSAAPVAAVTFAGLAAYTDLIFEFVGVGHDYGTAAQTFTLALSTDGVNFPSLSAFTPSITSGGAMQGSSLLIGNGLRRNGMRSQYVTGNPAEPSAPTGIEAPRLAVLSGALVAIRFTPTTSGNFNKGQINAWVR